MNTALQDLYDDLQEDYLKLRKEIESLKLTMQIHAGDTCEKGEFQMKVICRNCKKGSLCATNYGVVCELDGEIRHLWDTCEEDEDENT